MAGQRIGLAQAYLAIYNAAQAVAWSYCLYCLASGLASKEDPAALSRRVAVPVGLVPSSPLSVLQQWAGRSNVLFLVLGHALTAVSAPAANGLRSWASVCVTVGGLWGLPQFKVGRTLGLLTMAVSQHAAVASLIMMAAWSVSEVIRYPWYALTTLHMCPHALTWMRYTAFIPLYPVGVVAEIVVMLSALPRLAQTRVYSTTMPNRANMAFSYSGFLQCVLVAYPFLWWQLYSGLLRTRAKRLGQSSKKGEAAAAAAAKRKAE